VIKAKHLGTTNTMGSWRCTILHRLEGKSDFKKGRGRMLETTPLAHGADPPKPKAQSHLSHRNRQGEVSMERGAINYYPETKLLLTFVFLLLFFFYL
jgi:hypothetical protein